MIPSFVSTAEEISHLLNMGEAIEIIVRFVCGANMWIPKSRGIGRVNAEG